MHIVGQHEQKIDYLPSLPQNGSPLCLHSWYTMEKKIVPDLQKNNHR